MMHAADGKTKVYSTPITRNHNKSGWAVINVLIGKLYDRYHKYEPGIHRLNDEDYVLLRHDPELTEVIETLSDKSWRITIPTEIQAAFSNAVFRRGEHVFELYEENIIH